MQKHLNMTQLNNKGKSSIDDEEGNVLNYE